MFKYCLSTLVGFSLLGMTWLPFLLLANPVFGLNVLALLEPFFKLLFFLP